MTVVRTFRELETYRLCREAAGIIFGISARFPKTEVYSLTDQIRRSSRAVGAMIAEAWGRRRYRNVFICKLDEAIGEANETLAWLDFANDANYITEQEFTDLQNRYTHIAAKLSRMIDRADDFCKFAPDTDFRTREGDPDYTTSHISPLTSH